MVMRGMGRLEEAVKWTAEALKWRRRSLGGRHVVRRCSLTPVCGIRHH